MNARDGVPDQVLQAFICDPNKEQKLAMLPALIGDETLSKITSTRIGSIKIDVYEVKVMCGGCINYRIIDLIGGKHLAFSANIEPLLATLTYKHTKEKSCGQVHLEGFHSKIALIEDEINFFIDLEGRQKNLSISEKNNLVKVIFDGVLLESPYSKIIKETTNVILYNFKGVNIEILKFTASNPKTTIKIINPLGYRNTNF